MANHHYKKFKLHAYYRTNENAFLDQLASNIDKYSFGMIAGDINIDLIKNQPFKLTSLRSKY